MQLNRLMYLLPALLLALSAREARSSVLTPDLGLTEFLMDSEGELLMALAADQGANAAATLMFTANLDYANLTFSFQTAPGSTYAGMPIDYSATGFMDASGNGSYSGGGAIGGSNIAGDGNEKQSGSGADTAETVEIDHGNGMSDIYTVVGKIKYSGTNNLDSAATLEAGGKKYDGTDHIRVDSGGGKHTTWVLTLQDSGSGSGVKIDVSGLIDPSGFGLFTATVSPVPEPSAGWMLGVGCIALGLSRRRMRY